LASGHCVLRPVTLVVAIGRPLGGMIR